MIRRSILKNGTVLITESVRNFESLAVGVWVRGGSRHETKKTHGLAHFLEHMMFKGTKKRSALDIARAVDLIGGDFNAMTTREYTCFHLTLPAKEVDFSLDLLSDILMNSQFEGKELERERRVVLQEIAMLDDTAEEYVHEILFEKAFRTHPIALPILGTKGSVKSFRRTDLLQYFKKHYYSKNIVITLAGNVDHTYVVRKLNSLLGNFRGRKKKAPQTSLKIPKFYPGVHVKQKNHEQCHLALAIAALPIRHQDRIALFLLNSFLGGGLSSALFQKIREQHGLAYNVYSSLAVFSDCGVLGIYVATGTKLVSLCLKLIREEIDRLKEIPLSKEDLNIVKNSVKSAILLGSDAMENRMFALAKSEIYFERYLSNAEVCKQIDQVTAQDILRLARKIFTEDWCIVALGKVERAQIRKFFLKK